MTAFLFGAFVYTFLAYHVICWPFVEHFGCALKTKVITASLLTSVLMGAASLSSDRWRLVLFHAFLGVLLAYVADGVWWSIAGTIQLGRFYVAFP